MPKVPIPKVMTNVTVDVINAIRNGASQSYKDYVPYATEDTDSIRNIGNIIMDNPALRNEFIDTLVNRIAYVIVTSKLYQNPLRMFKKGFIEVGETIEEIFVNITEAQQFSPEDAENTLFKRNKPDVRSAFHVMNLQKFYPITVSRQQLKSAFTSWSGVTDLISKIVETLYTSANYDDYLLTKYLLGRHIVNNNIAGVQVAGVDTDENAKKTVSVLKGVSNKMTFMSKNYNMAGVYTHSDKSDQYVFINAMYDALLDTEVLAYAFGRSLADFNVSKILVDDFYEIDYTRLNELLDDNTSFQPFTTEEINKLKNVVAVVVDKDFFQMYDNLMEIDEQYNGKGLYWNYFLHIWRTYSVSPFAQAIYATTDNVNEVVLLDPKNTTIADIHYELTGKTTGSGEASALSGTTRILNNGKTLITLSSEVSKQGKVILKNGTYNGTGIKAVVKNGTQITADVSETDYNVEIPFSTGGNKLTIKYTTPI